MKKIEWSRTLVLSGLFAGAQKVAESAGAGGHSQLGATAAALATAVGASVVASYLSNRANSQREAELSQAAHDELAAKNHHLRRGMAAALRRGLEQAREDIPALKSGAAGVMVEGWVFFLGQCEKDPDALERFFPAALAESHWEATNSYRENLDEGAFALAELLRKISRYEQRDVGESIDLIARQVLPYYGQAFANDLAGDSNGLLFQAFTVKGINQIRFLVEQLIEEDRAAHARTHGLLEELKDLVQPRPIDLGRVLSWALPPQTGFFTGRDEFLASLHQTLQEKRKVLICAAGGYGKTQAALEYVRRFGGHYEDVLWVRASDASSLFQSYREIARGLGRLPQSVPTEADVQRAVKSWLAERPNALLVFDNLDDPKLAADYWPTATPLPFLLATSQKNDVSELARMEPLELDVFGAPEALDFLEERTRRTGLTGPERAAAAALADETGYLPLALEQAGAYIAKNGTSFRDYVATYRKARLGLLEKHGPVAGDYKLSVATTWKASMDRMPGPARELLYAVSHLAPYGIPFELIACAPDALGPGLERALSDESEVDPLAAMLADLQGYSLLRIDKTTATFSMHRLLREVVRADQTEGQRSEWIARWVRVFDRFLPKDVGATESAPYSRGWVAFEALFFSMGEEHPAIEEAVALANWFVYHFNQRGRWRESERAAVRAMELRERVLGREHPTTLTSVNNLAGLYWTQGRYAEAEPLYLRALDARERILGREHPDTLASVNNLAGLYQSQGRYAEAEPLYLRALDARERILGREHPDTLTSVNNLAGLYQSQGRDSEVEPLYLRALDARERVLGREHPDTLTSVNNLAGLYESQWRYAEAEPLYLRALDARERVLGREHPDTLTSVNNLAGLYQSQGRYAEAEPLYLRALDARERILGREHPDTLTSVNNLAGLYQSQGRDSEVEPLYLRALDARERVLGREHPDTLASVNNLAGLYESQGRYAEAEPLYQRALDACERVLGREHPSTLTSVNNLAFLYESQGRYAEAEPLYQRSLDARERVLGREHPSTLTSVNNLAGLYESQGRHAEAEPLYQRALDARERVLGREHPSTLTSVNNLAGLYESQGRYAEAEPLFKRALDARERVLGREHPDTLASVNNLASLYQSQGRYAEAEPLYQRALDACERLLGREHPKAIGSVNNLAFLYGRQGRYAEAEPLYLRALDASERVLGREHPTTQLIRANLDGLRSRDASQ